MAVKTIKATVRCSGRVIEVYQQKDKFIEVGRWEEWKAEELDFAKDIDWQQVRIQSAIAAMNIVKDAYNVHNDMERLVHHAVRIADALVTELKKGGQDDNNH